MIALLLPESEGTMSIRERLLELAQTVSASRLLTFHACRLKFCFRYVLELAKPTSAALLVGKTVHATLERWNLARWRVEPCDPETLRPHFLSNWVEHCPVDPRNWPEEEEQRERIWDLIRLYLAETPIPFQEKPEAVEVRLEADLGRHGLPTLVGVLDLVRPGGRIVDFKTSATSPHHGQAGHRHETQLTAYGILYRDATGEPEAGFELHHLVKTKSPKVIITRFGPTTEDQQNRLFRSIESYVEGVERQDFIPSPGQQRMTCEYFAECCVWKGGL